MASGHSTQLTKQIGEHLVAAKLGRMGYVATPFAGNVPLFDILAADQNGVTIPIQVKAINRGAWQYRADSFLEIDIAEGFQHVRGKRLLPNPYLICVYICLKPDELDDFYVFYLRELQEFTSQVYRSRRRPKNPQSTHCAIYPKDLTQFLGNWNLIDQAFRREEVHNAGY